MALPPTPYYNIRMNVSARSVRVYVRACVVYEETRFC
jgi:hypothetical protein